MSIIIAFFILVTIILAIMVIIWRTESNEPKMKYKDFRKFYAINPDRWGLYSNNVYCRGAACFSFGFIDFYKYKLWLHGEKKKDRNQYYAKCTQRMLDAVKEDVESAKAKSHSDIVASIRTTIEALKRSGDTDILHWEQLLRKAMEERTDESTF